MRLSIARAPARGALLAGALLGAAALDARAQSGGGRLAIGERAFCGATMIAPTVVVTAAHCLEPDGDRLDPTRISFRPFGGRKAVPVSGLIAHGGYRHAGGAAVENLARDIALLRLSERAGGGVAAVGALKGPAVRMRPSSVSGMLSCTVSSAALGPGGALAAIECPAHRGSSGSGVFDAGRLVAVVSAGARARAGRPPMSLVVRLDRSSGVIGQAR